ncbi:MAG TPA: hypothetical protein VMS00_11070 [Acidimicrobiales bacterium]|nr:hypothetical protein [Acidimicrobiales bacterium]
MSAHDHAAFDAGAENETRAGGFTLLELTLAMGLFLVIIAAFVSFISPAMKGSNVAEALVTNEQAVSLVLLQMEKDIRAANPLDVFDPTACYTYTYTTYDDQIQVQLGPNGGTQQTVLWVYSPTNDTLKRELISGTGCNPTVLSTTDVVPNILNGSTPVFTYFDDTQTNLVVPGNASTPDYIGDCAVQIGIDLTGQASNSARPFTEQVNVQIRDRLPGGMPGCA